MYLVHKVYRAVALAELVLRVDEYEAHLGGYLAAAGIDGARVTLQLLVLLAADQPRSYDLLLRDILVVTLGGLRRGGDDGLGELLVLDHALGHRHSADGALAGLVLAPCVAREVAADHHLDLEGLALAPYGDHRVGHGDLPVGEDVGRGVEELGRDLVQNLSLVGYALGQDYVKGRDAVGDDHHQITVVDVVNVADLAGVLAALALEGEIGTCDSVHCVCGFNDCKDNVFARNNSLSACFACRACVRTALCGVRRPPARPCAPLGTMCTGYLRRAVPVSSVWLCAHLVWLCAHLVWLCAHLVRLRGQGVAACGRMYDGRRVKRKFAVWRYRVWGYQAVLWNIVSRMWQIVQSAGRFEKCEYKKSVKSRNLLFRQLCQVRIS